MANIEDSKRNYSDFIAGNKKVTPVDVKFIERIIAPRMRFAFPEATNLLTGWHKGTNPSISTLVMLTQDLAYNEFAPSMLHKWGVPPGMAIQMYDRARMLILKLDSDIYSNVID